MLQYKREGDELMAPVMPDSWQGFARLAVDDYHDDLTREQYEFARELAERVAEQKPEVPRELIGEKAVEMAKEKV